MEKHARKPSADPAQEKLREEKAIWNKEVSELVGNLIDAKKLMNGWPNKFYKERSRITRPIPADPATIIGALAGDFQDIANKANTIIRDQINYSKSRRQKQPKPTGAPSTSTPDLSRQLSANDHTYYLISQASNPLSRFFHRLLSPGVGLDPDAARLRKYRMSLLDASVALDKDLKKLMTSIVSSGDSSLFVSSKLLDNGEDSYVFLASGLRSFQDAMPSGATNTGGTIQPSKPAEEPAPKMPRKGAQPPPDLPGVPEMIADIQANASNFKGGTEGMPALRLLMAKFLQAPPEEQKAAAAEMEVVYRRVIAQLSADRGYPVQPSLQAILDQSRPKEEGLQTQAQNWLGKVKHRISPFDRTSAQRLDIYRGAKEARKLTDQIMDHLEKTLNMDVVWPMAERLGKELLNIRTVMNNLMTTVKGQGYGAEFLGRLNKERGINLGDKQKGELERLLKQKQNRELSKMYSR